MTFSITLPPETEQKLRERAARAGQTVEDFLRQLVEREVLETNGSQAPEAGTAPAGKTFDEIFAPLRKEVEASGIGDEELDRLLEQAREEAWQEKKPRQDPHS
jgi:plasmid stability protein